jgi:hypothetical protein
MLIKPQRVSHQNGVRSTGFLDRCHAALAADRRCRFARVVHDKLRDIAHEERKTVTDLINEGLDDVLRKRSSSRRSRS